MTELLAPAVGFTIGMVLSWTVGPQAAIGVGVALLAIVGVAAAVRRWRSR